MKTGLFGIANPPGSIITGLVVRWCGLSCSKRSWYIHGYQIHF